MPRPNNLRSRLKRMGVKSKPATPPTPPAAEQASPSPSTPSSDSSELTYESLYPTVEALGGQEVETTSGPAYVIEKRYPISHLHGNGRLLELFGCDAPTASELAKTTDTLDLRKLAFVDTETTGLAGGAGTLAFLVGVGFFEGDDYVLQQLFLREPAEERAMLNVLMDTLGKMDGLVTYNGRTFDVPLLNTRLTMNRRPAVLKSMPNLDLLTPARRMWRGRLENCRLATVEEEALGVHRTGDDVPGWLIPQLYAQFLNDGNATEMQRVLYHNEIDILSMVTLTTRLLRAFGSPTHPSLSGDDCVRLATWLDDQGRAEDAEEVFEAALSRPLEHEAYLLTLKKYSAFLKKLDRRADAIPHWEMWAAYEPAVPDPFEEIAKFFEWHAPDFSQALDWTERGLAGIQTWKNGWKKRDALEAFEHRKQRLLKKVADLMDGDDA